MISTTLYNKIDGLLLSDPGITSEMHKIEQLVFLVFLKISSLKDQKLIANDENFESIAPEELCWASWATPQEGKKLLTGPELIHFMNHEFIPVVKDLPLLEKNKHNRSIFKTIFHDVNNHMTDGYLLREVINLLDENIGSSDVDQVDLGNKYEEKLKNFLSIPGAGQFYTPLPLTDFINELIKPQADEVVADFVCGTGGFLSSSLKYRKNHLKDFDESDYSSTIYGSEKRPLPYMIAVSTLYLQNVDDPWLELKNCFDKDVTTYRDDEKFDVILMDPTYGNKEKREILEFFPEELRSNSITDLLIVLMMYRMKKGGRGAIIVSDSFLFSNDNNKHNIKEKLFGEFNVHTIIRLPPYVFAPYSNIKTNIIFFENTHPTIETWFYRVDMPKGYKRFTKRKPLLNEHLAPTVEWYNNKKEIIRPDGNIKAKKYSIEHIKKDDYKLNYCILSSLKTIANPDELIRDFRKNRDICNKEIEDCLNNIEEILNSNYFEW
jgi:type I restriction enzyme M protein